MRPTVGSSPEQPSLSVTGPLPIGICVMRRSTSPVVLGTAVGLVLTGVACGPLPDPRALAALAIVDRTDRVAGCRLVGPIEGKASDRTTTYGLSYEAALADLKRKAVLSGGDHVIIDQNKPPRDGDYAPEYLLHGRAFACAPSGAAPAPSAGAGFSSAASSVGAPKACEPDCSPAYTCLRGVCISACNPPCEATEQCGADRTCHPCVVRPGTPNSSAPSTPPTAPAPTAVPPP